MTWRIKVGRKTAGSCILRLSRVIATALVAATPLASAAAADPAPVRAYAPATGIDRGRLAGLADFIDGVVAEQIATRDVAGAVVTVVHKGRVLFNRGYGHADIARGALVDPSRTVFRPGSVSKLFTWVALMQQVEQGRVDLDADVNAYLDFKVPAFGSKPVRVRDLLSHSPGLGDVGGLTVDAAAKLRPYAEWLKTRAAAPRWEPGTEIAYSNYGAALAGYIVERVSGEPFADYAEKHLFAPLGMTATTFREPLPANMVPHMATGYALTDGRLTSKPFEYFSGVMPAGSASATGPDMARFMLAMLDDGRLGSARVLKPASVRLLFSDSKANAPRLPGMAHGFMVAREAGPRGAGPRLVGHGGNTVDFHSYLVLAPQEDFGFFVSMTGGPGSYPARTELSDAIIGRLFPQAPAARWTGREPPPPLGGYRINRRDYAATADPARDLVVTMPAPHRLTVENAGRKTSWEQIGPRLYEQATGAREGGPFDRLELYDGPTGPRLSFASQPYVAYHHVER